MLLPSLSGIDDNPEHVEKLHGDPTAQQKKFFCQKKSLSKAIANFFRWSSTQNS